MIAKPKRRWYRFSLRTLFVIVTVAGAVAAWVAYEYRWQRDRNEMLAQMLGSAITPNVVFAVRIGGEAPWQVRLFSGEGCKEIWLRARMNTTTAEQEQAIAKMKSLFPEANVRITNH